MVTTLLLIRHAAHDRVNDVLCGRMDGVALSMTGHAQAEALATWLRATPIDAVHSSPIQRARETAAHLSNNVCISDGMTEIDFGGWTGRTFAELADDPLWRAWNTARSTAHAPGGETMRHVQGRAMTTVSGLVARHAGSTIALCSHGDVIKSVLMSYLGMSLDDWHRFDVAPASVSRLLVWKDGGKVASMNETAPA